MSGEDVHQGERRGSSVHFLDDEEQVNEDINEGDNIAEEGKLSKSPSKKKISDVNCKCGDKSHHPQPSMWQTACTKCLSHVRLKRNRSSIWDLDGIFDPYKTFEVKHEHCFDLAVTVHRGESITKGSDFKDALDIPDPYILLRIPQIKLNTPKRTRSEDNSTNPIWEQTFHFYIFKNPSEPYVMEINLMDENVLIDEAIDSQLFSLDCLEEGIPEERTFTFKGGSKVFITFEKTKNEETDLRFSMSLCEEEKAYLMKRRKNVFESMKTLLGEDGPQSGSEIPTIGILGSGGGFRAMIGLSGALKALQDSEILDCTTYLAGLSGSTWTISTLYCGSLNVNEFQETLCKSVSKKWEWNILKMPQYLGETLAKYWKGQSMSPVTLVDIFGHLIGDVLLGKEKKNKKLSDLQAQVSEGEAPFPLFAGLHATERSSEEFSEWIEFSPYEIGMGKYGTFMKTEHFGSKFLAGKLMKRYNEMPLHYLQAMWGSAFTVNLKRHLIGATSSISENIDEFERPDNNDEEDPNSDIDSDDSEDEVEDAGGNMSLMKMKKRREKSVEKGRRLVSSMWTFWKPWTSWESWASWVYSNTWLSWTSWSSWMTSLLASRKRDLPEDNENSDSPEPKSQNWFVSALESVGINSSYLLNLRAVKPGRIYNPFRGLALQYSFSEDEVDSHKEEEKIKYAPGCKFQPLSQQSKRISVMDSGFAFNSPYPLLLRPQRGVDIFLSFDFSHRNEDMIVDLSSFKHLIKAEEWAKERHIPFPAIKEKVDENLGKELQECYVFESISDYCIPVILHFPLVNNKFRQSNSPGSSEEEVEFSNFPCFGENSDFSTFKFNYETKEFNRLAKLMEFNTLLHKNTVIEEIKKSVINKRKAKKLGINEIAKILLWHKRNQE